MSKAVMAFFIIVLSFILIALFIHESGVKYYGFVISFIIYGSVPFGIVTVWILSFLLIIWGKELDKIKLTILGQSCMGTSFVTLAVYILLQYGAKSTPVQEAWVAECFFFLPVLCLIIQILGTALAFMLIYESYKVSGKIKDIE